jgi:hypothetical protein
MVLLRGVGMKANDLLMACARLEHRIQGAILVDRVSEDKGVLLAMIETVREALDHCPLCWENLEWKECAACDGGEEDTCAECDGKGGWWRCPVCGAERV